MDSVVAVRGVAVSVLYQSLRTELALLRTFCCGSAYVLFKLGNLGSSISEIFLRCNYLLEHLVLRKAFAFFLWTVASTIEIDS